MTPDVILRLLPEIYRTACESGNAPLNAIVSLLAELNESTEDFLGDPWRCIQPWRCDDRYLVSLAGWVGLSEYIDENRTTAESDLRELTRRAAALARSRGTRDSLGAILELITGIDEFKIEEHVVGEDGREIPYHIRVAVPPAGNAHRDIIEHVISREKPCYTTAEIVFSEA